MVDFHLPVVSDMSLVLQSLAFCSISYLEMDLIVVDPNQIPKVLLTRKNDRSERFIDRMLQSPPHLLIIGTSSNRHFYPSPHFCVFIAWHCIPVYDAVGSKSLNSLSHGAGQKESCHHSMVFLQRKSHYFILKAESNFALPLVDQSNEILRAGNTIAG